MKNGKRNTYLFIYICAIACIVKPFTAQAVIDKAIYNEQRVIVAKGDKQFAPFEFINEKGEPDGFSVELFETLMKKLNLKYKLTLDDWDKVQNELFNKKIDMAIGMIYSAERAEKVKFGIPHSMISYNIICRKDKDFLTMKSLEDQEVIVQKHDRAHEYLLDTKLTDKIITVDRIEDGIKMLSEGKGDAVISFDVTSFYFVRTGNYRNLRIHMSGMNLERYSMVVNTDNEELLYMLNTALYQMKIDGEYDRIYYKWFGIYEKNKLYKTVWYVLMGLGGFIVLCSFFILILKLKVNTVTSGLKAKNEEALRLVDNLREENLRRLQTEKNLIAAKEKAEESDRLKSAFLASMSHEIRTPLNSIVGFSSLIVDAEDSQQRAEYYKYIENNNALLLQIINDILDLSQIESGAMAFSDNSFSLSALCSQIVALARNDKENVRIIEDLQYDCTLLTDLSRLQQVLTHLLVNALKFTDNGTVVLGTRKEDDNHVRIFVKDTGIGIPVDKTDTIFNRFVKLNDFTQGTGLGLAICKQILEHLGAKIYVESSLGVGSEFWIIFPIVNK